MSLRLVVATSALLALTGCGGGGHAPTPVRTSMAIGGGVAVESARDVASQAGCTDFREVSRSRRAEVGTCLLGTDKITTTWFTKPRSVAEGDVASGAELSSRRWRVVCESLADCRAIEKRLGGTLSP
jgi:hypothetical protein